MTTPTKPRTPRTTLNKRTPAQRQQDLVDIARLLREGKTHHEIAEWIRLNRPYKLSRTQVTYDSAELLRNWRANAAEAVQDRIAKQLASIDALEAEAWKAWSNSKGEVTEVQQEQVGGEGKDGKGRVRAIVKKSMSHGDPRYMHVISHCIEARNRLLGLTKNRTELTGPGGGPLEVEGVTGDFDMAAIDKFLEAQYGERLAKAKGGRAQLDGSIAFSR